MHLAMKVIFIIDFILATELAFKNHSSPKSIENTRNIKSKLKKKIDFWGSIKTKMLCKLHENSKVYFSFFKEHDSKINMTFILLLEPLYSLKNEKITKEKISGLKIHLAKLNNYWNELFFRKINCWISCSNVVKTSLFSYSQSVLGLNAVIKETKRIIEKKRGREFNSDEMEKYIKSLSFFRNLIQAIENYENEIRRFEKNFVERIVIIKIISNALKYLSREIAIKNPKFNWIIKYLLKEIEEISDFIFGFSKTLVINFNKIIEENEKVIMIVENSFIETERI